MPILKKFAKSLPQREFTHRTTTSVVLSLCLLVCGLIADRPGLVEVIGAPASDAIYEQSREMSYGTARRITVHAAGHGNTAINLSDGCELPTSYRMTRNGQAGSSNLGRPLALSSADFDEDGVPDLVSGWAGSGTGLISLHRGTADATSPQKARQNQPATSDGNQQSTEESQPAPFLPSANVTEIPQAPEFLGTGDFDADGHWDVVSAARGANMISWLRGDGRGGFILANSIELPGLVTALATGEVNRADGLTDLIVAVAGTKGAQVLIFSAPGGAFNKDPEAIAVSAEVTSLATGMLDGDYLVDLAVASANNLIVVHGIDPYAVVQRQQAITRRSFNSFIESEAIGDFNGDGLAEIALLTADGALQVLSRTTASVAGQQTRNVVSQRESSAAGSWPHATHLLTARVSSRPGDSLILIDPVNYQLHVLGPRGPMAGAETSTAKESPLDSPVTLGVEGEPVAILPMQLNADALSDLVILRAGEGALTTMSTKSQATFTVTDTTDSGPGSLRQAILDANAAPGLDTINFTIGTGPQTIRPITSLPTVLGPTVIDGTTQPGFAGSPIIELDGSSVPTSSGLSIIGGNSTVRGLVVNRFLNGIFLGTNGNNVVEGNFVGTDIAGNVALGNTTGIFIGSSPNNTIGGTTANARNIVSGNVAGINIDSSSGNLLQNNYVGTDVTGGNTLSNTGVGVRITINSSASIIGGTVAGARNLISGNLGPNVVIIGGSANNLVQGNHIGTDVTGNIALGNGNDGMLILSASDNTIGGTTPAARNIISGNFFDGIFIDQIQGQTPPVNNLVQGNYIGTNITGDRALGNRFAGVDMFNSTGTVIGGTAAGARNLISGNSSGIFIGSGSTNSQVQGNYIGTNASGTAAVGNTNGINIIGSSNNTIGGITAEARNLISGNTNLGIFINNGSNNNQVQGNYIGTDVAGTAALGNVFNGVHISNSSNNTIGGTMAEARNLISGNGSFGVIILANSANNQVQGNYIGTDLVGSAAVGNGSSGVGVFGASNNTVGGATAEARNLISGNGLHGIHIGTNSTNNQVQGNFIGANVSGDVALSNQGSGVHVTQGSNNLIGGAAAGARNLISGNLGSGISIIEGLVDNGMFEGANDNRVQGNYIGTNIAGNSAIGNGNGGIVIRNSLRSIIGDVAAGAGNLISGNAGAGLDISTSSDTLVQGNIMGADAAGTASLGNANQGVILSSAPRTIIGGITPGARNIISANGGDGVVVDNNSPDNQILGNYVGSDVSGSRPLGNAGVGISIRSSNTMVGGIVGGAANRIAFNQQDGVVIVAGTANSVLSNAIFSNANLGIDLDTAGPAPNDSGDSDAGSNNLQNYPLLSSISSSGGGTSIQGVLNSTPNTSFRIEFFSNTACDPTGYGEGETLIGTANVTTGADGTANITFTTSGPAGTLVTATATDPNGNTSEFSPCGLPRAVFTPGSTITVGPVTASSEPNANPESSTFTITNSGTAPVSLTLASLLRAGDAQRLANVDDRAIFSIRLINADGTETPLTVGPTSQAMALPPGQNQRFRVLFNPLIPALAGRFEGLFANQVVPEVVNSRLTINQSVGPPLTLELIGRIHTAVRLIHPIDPRRAPLVTLTRSGDQFEVRASVYDPNLDLRSIQYQFLDQSGNDFGRPTNVELGDAIRGSSLVRGQSFTIAQRFEGAQDFPEIAAVRVRVSDTESSATATSGALGAVEAGVASVSAASFHASGIADESVVAAFGTNLSAITQVADSVPLPMALGRTRVLIRDGAGVERAAPIFFVSPGQLNYQIPAGTAVGAATITVLHGEEVVARDLLQVSAAAPGLFAANSDGQGVAAGVALRVKADGTQSYEPVAQFDAGQNRFVYRPLDLGHETDEVYLVLFGTGIRHFGSTVRANVGGEAAQVLYAGPQGNFVGVDQINLRLPRSLSGRGEIEIELSVDERKANTVKVMLQSGLNAAVGAKSLAVESRVETQMSPASNAFLPLPSRKLRRLQ